jgi:hypothetical protein
MWVGSMDLVVMSTIVPQALVQSGAGVESYSDASSGLASIVRNEVKCTKFSFSFILPYDLLRNFSSKKEPM